VVMRNGLLSIVLFSSVCSVRMLSVYILWMVILRVVVSV